MLAKDKHVTGKHLLCRLVLDVSRRGEETDSLSSPFTESSGSASLMSAVVAVPPESLPFRRPLEDFADGTVAGVTADLFRVDPKIGMK
jgi:hypothetical protein